MQQSVSGHGGKVRATLTKADYIYSTFHLLETVPGARRGTSLWQPDFLHYVWIFGGQGYDANPASGNGYLADLCTYLPYP
jgi:hypothetical protein